MGDGLADAVTRPGAPRPLAPRVLSGARAAAWRVGWFLATLSGAALLVAVLLWAAPGDPIDLLPNGEELRPVLEAEWGLDQPLPTRITTFLAHAATGDLGTSLTVRPGTPVASLVASAAGRSALLLIPALLLGATAAVSLAWVTAGRRSVLRWLVQAVSVAPVFLLAYLLVLGLNEGAWALINADVIARPVWFALPDQPSPLRTALAIGVLAFASGSLTELHAACEDEITRLRNSGFVEAALARGAPTWRHVLLNLVPPLTHIATRRVAFLVGGLVIIEKVLMLNGAGSLMWEASLHRDYPLAMGLALGAALVVSAAHLLGDVVRLAVDPRLRART